jgi:hypothetical protein
VLVGESAVDGDLSGRRRCRALDQVGVVELGIVDPESTGRAIGERVPVVAEERDVARELAGDPGDLGERRDAVVGVTADAEPDRCVVG